ncbi:AGAP006671-PA-like protein [Anopheles sinensis]|uniref:AGAP006671-PA-like protein n=1 Tax=Anopheles sinensis TaxID=74873 RepID=A0A084WA71_ANOSI|nr:AGAP006671-PA-like protein [Anopheles sinensis]
MFTFADPALELLEQFAQIRLLTGLCIERPELSYLEEYVYQRESKRLEGKLQAVTLRSDISALRARCEAETKEVHRLECFLEETQQLTTPVEEFEKKKASQEKNIELVKNKAKSIPNPPEDINLDELIDNVRRLEEEYAGRGGNE